MNEATILQRCVVCDGRGLLPHGFYRPETPDGTFDSSSTEPETCRTCNGSGVMNVTQILRDHRIVVNPNG